MESVLLQLRRYDRSSIPRDMSYSVREQFVNAVERYLGHKLDVGCDKDGKRYIKYE